MGVANALEALYRHFKVLLLTLSPSHELELESDRAGRAAELRVFSLYVSVLLSFFPCAISSISQFFFSNPLLILLPCFSFPFLLGEKAPAFVYCKVLLAYGADLKGFQECKCTSVFAYPLAKRAAAKLILFLSPKGQYVFLHLLLLRLH